MKRKLQQQAKESLIKMGYKVREWTAYREGWLFGFVQKDQSNYGCIAFLSTGMISIEILQQKEYKTFNV